MNLIICMTPLQVLIANTIIRQSNSLFIGVYLTDMPSQKHEYYAKKLEAHCQKFAYIAVSNQSTWVKFTNFYTIEKAIRHLPLANIDTLYLANLDLLLPLYITGLVNYRNLMTFDDGTANIFPNSRYFSPPKISIAKRIFKYFLGIKYIDIHAVIKGSQKHFTIFPHEKNIIDNIEPIYLFDKTKTEHNENLPVKRLLLGQALDNFIGETAYRDIVAKMVSEFAIDAFCPHPRENIDFSYLLPVIHSDKIIEDYLLDELSQHPNQRFEIYTFISTAVFSLKQFPRTQIFMVYNQTLWDKFSDAYQFLASRGFTLINLDKLEQEVEKK